MKYELETVLISFSNRNMNSVIDCVEIAKSKEIFVLPVRAIIVVFHQIQWYCKIPSMSISQIEFLVVFCIVSFGGSLNLSCPNSYT